MILNPPKTEKLRTLDAQIRALRMDRDRATSEGERMQLTAQIMLLTGIRHRLANETEEER